MATPKGYTSQEKEDRLSAEFCTISPVGEFKHALDVSQKALTEAGTDAAEAGSTAYIIAATAHIAKKGDVIRFTSGTFDGIECNVYDVSTDTIVLGQTLPSAIGSGDTFSILTPVSLTLDASGNITTSSAPIQFVLDSVDTTVTEDTVTPSNNSPLPVKITSTSGDINITAGDLNVQTSHSGASYDSMRIGDGTEIVDVNASNEMQVADDTARSSLSTIAGDTTSLDGKVTACDTGNVAIASALPAGTNNIGDVDVASSVLPTGAATEATLATIAGDTTSLDGKVTACDTGDVTISAALPAGTNNM